MALFKYFKHKHCETFPWKPLGGIHKSLAQQILPHLR